jgi:hypothetical protein
VRLVAVLLPAAALLAVSGTQPVTAQTSGCLGAPAAVHCGVLDATLFPADNWWNVRVDSAPLDPRSTAIVGWIGTTRGMHPDFGGNDEENPPGIYGMVHFSVPGTQPLVTVPFYYDEQSDPGAPGRPPGYPIPPEAKTNAKWIEGGYPGNANPSGDKHMLIVDRDNRLLFELYDLSCVPTGSPSCSWEAGSGATWSLDTNTRRPFGWTSGDAAGLAILPGLVRYSEAYSGSPIAHAFRVTTRGVNGFVYPASHDATTSTNVNAPALGTRLRLRSTFTLPGYPSGATAADRAAMDRVVTAMKEYGLVVADTGSDMYVSGAYDTRWDNGVWNPFFSSIKAGDFEVVEQGWGSARFRDVTPCRLVDTRLPAGDYGGPAIPAGGERSFVAAEVCGLPASVRAISGNVTVEAAAATGTLSIFPGDRSAGDSWTLAYPAGKTRATAFLSRLSGASATTAWGTFTVRNDGPVAVNVIVDVNGWFE